MSKELDQVREFHNKFDIHMSETPIYDYNEINSRIEFLYEEFNELKSARDFKDVELIADALVDIVYVALGAAAALGLPWDELFDDVHRANMGKIQTNEVNYKHGLVKPKGWIGPKTKDILIKHGYKA